MDAIARNFRNTLLAGFSEAQLGHLAPEMEPVELPVKAVLQGPDAPLEHVYFPGTGIGSVIAIGTDGQRIEAGLFGRDGMSGLPVVWDDDRSPHEVVMQVPGTGHRLAADALREAMAAEPAIRARFLRYGQAFAVQVTLTALANARHTLPGRLARWLLMCHDRINGDAMELTHEFLSVMLGVRRSGVTVAIHELEGRGYITATRGRLRILDRGGLEALAHGIYGVPEAEYARLLGDGVSRG